MNFASLFVVFSLPSLDQISDYVRIPYMFIFWSDHRHTHDQLQMMHLNDPPVLFIP